MARGGIVTTAYAGKAEYLTPTPLRAVRAWDLTSDGWLTGIFFTQIWTPGENKAQCRQTRRTEERICFHPQFDPDAGPDSREWPKCHPTACFALAQPCPTPPDPTEGERCGFYGFFDGSRDYEQASRISGVIAVYGHILVGERGLRAQYARILGLFVPDLVVISAPQTDTPAGATTWAGPDSVELLHEHYSNIPFYATRDDLLAALPLTPL
jgi:hypothetical protein